MASKRVKDGPHWVKAWISELSALTDQFRDIETGAVDFEALGREEYHFRMALSRRDFNHSERARKVWEEAVGPYQQRVSAAKKNPQDAPNGNAGVDGKSGTSANIYGPRQAKNGDAARREAADGETDGNVPPSHGHEDGTIHDQETIGISTNNKRTGGQSPLSQYPSSRPPVRDRRVSGDVLTLAYSGEFGNVRLTQEQYGELGIKFGNLAKLNRAIDSLSCKLENDELKPVPRSHYAVLVKWASYREDMEEQKIQQSEAPKMTEMEKSWIREAEKIARYEKDLAANVRR